MIRHMYGPQYRPHNPTVTAMILFLFLNASVWPNTSVSNWGTVIVMVVSSIHE